MKNLLVVYHSPCMDGFGAACAFNDQVDKSEWDTITYYPCGYGQLAELKYMVGNNPLSGKTHVLCLDICPTPETLDFMLVDRGLNVAILDHHDTAMDNLEEYTKTGILFTVTEDYSGASLVKALGKSVNRVFNQDIGEAVYLESEGILTNNDIHKYLDSSLITDSPLFTLLEVRDLWIRTDAALKQQADDMAAYFKKNDISKGPLIPMAEFEALVPIALKEGRVINAELEIIVNEAIAKSVTWDQEVDGEKLSILVGEVPQELGSLFGSVYNDSCDCNSLAVGTYSEGGLVQGLSLRSKGDTGYARIVAETFGGGGHNHASGANFKAKPLTQEQLIDRVKQALQS